MTELIDPSGLLERLRRLWPSLPLDGVVPERRGDRALLRLPDDRLAWVALTPAAAAALGRENRVLDLVGTRCGFAMPRVLAASDDGCTVRTTVPGRVDPDGLAARLKREPALVPEAGRALGRILAEQHTQVVEEDVAGWLPTRPCWPLPRADIADRLPRVVDDPALRRRIDRLLDACDELGTTPEDRVLIHSDLGLHNVAFDPDTGAINGVFDYGDAAWADRHLDFRYLVFGAVQDALLDAAVGVYRAATGAAIDRRRVLISNAAAAVSHLADRAGYGPDDNVAGRTLAGDLRWTGWALLRAGF